MEKDIETAAINRRSLIADVIACCIVCFGLYECAIGWLQICKLMPSRHAMYPATGTFYNPGPYCGFLAMIAPLALYMAIGGKPAWQRVPATLCLVATIGIMPALMGRTGWIACATGCLIVLAGCRRLPLLKKRHVPAAILVLTAIMAFLVCLKPASALGRVFLWLTGLSACLGHPLAGCGWSKVSGAIGQAQERYFAAYPDSIFADVAACPQYPFNEYLQIGIAYGIAAMIIFAGLLTFAAVAAYRAKRFGLCGSIAAFVIVCMSSYPLQFVEFWIAASLLIIAALIQVAERRAIWCRLMAVVVCACAAYHSIILISAKEKADEWSRHKFAYQYSLDDGDIAYLDSLRAGLGANADFMFDYGQALRRSKKYEKSNEILLSGIDYSSDPMFLILIGRNCHDMQLHNDAAMWYARAINRLPSRLYPYYLMAKLYAEHNYYDKDKFEEYYHLFLKTGPKIESPATRQMKEELSIINDSIQASR